MSDHSFVPYRDLTGPRPPPGGEEPFDPVAARRRWLRAGDPNPEGGYVLYWLQMYKRGEENPALSEAARHADSLRLPLVVYEGLNPDYPEANARTHRFILECARDTAQTLERRGIRYVFRLPRSRAEIRQAAARMIRHAALVVVDDFPAFVLPAMTRRALELTGDSRVPVLAFDANGVVPLREIPGREYAARTIRPKIHRLLPSYLHPVEDVTPDRSADPLDLPVEGLEEPTGGDPPLHDADDGELSRWCEECEVDHDVLPSLRFRGGRRAGLERLEAFIREDLPRYHEESRDPGAGATSGLSPYLHFGCLDPREVTLRVLGAGTPEEAVDAFLEQLVIRRELAYNFCLHSDAHQSLEDLPDWALTTLSEHRDDPREHVYSEGELEGAQTHDDVWNAAQRELVATGHMHNYLRMLWGKQIIRWTETHEEAQRIMIRFHHRYALDGRNPNTYANVLWCFGLHDRAWQETPVLGKTRPMTSRSTRRKFNLDPYLERVDRWAREREMPVLATESS